MLTWIEKDGIFYGYDANDELTHIVEWEDHPDGGWWLWANVREDYGECCFDTVEEAKTGAEQNYTEWSYDRETLGGEYELSEEELAEIYGDMLYHERKDMGVI